MNIVAFGGSRRLQPRWREHVRAVVRRLVAFPSLSFAVGDAVGADQFALDELVAVGAAQRSVVFSVGAVGGLGSWAATASESVRAAARAGAAVREWAGGSLAVPLSRRLAGRTVACVRGARALVLWLASPASRGSLGAARAAVRGGARVFVFCCGAFGPGQLPVFGPGAWQAVASGPLAGAWEWVAA